MKRVILSALAAGIFATAAAQEELTLRKCLEIGLENNYDIRIVRNEKRISDNNATAANAGMVPTIDFEAGYSGALDNERTTPREGDAWSDNGIYDQTFNAGINLNWTIFDGLDEMDRIAAETLGDDFRTALAGDSKEFRESSSSLMFAFLLAILLIYLILAAQFESFKDPLVIMLTVPLAIAGALVFMAANGQTMNIFSQIGIIMLIGLVAKNGILIVEFANQKQEAGIDKLHAIEEASLQRLRPILMTSASTILGLLPLTVATGEGANGRIAMGIAVVGGMVVSTLLTLYIVPAIYSYVSTDRSKKQK